MKNIILFIAFFMSFLHITYSQESENMKNQKVDNDIETKVKGILKSLSTSKIYLTIRIFPIDYFDDSTKKYLVYRTDFDDMISVLSLNLEETVRLINKDDIKHWNESTEDIFAAAIDETENQLKNLSFESYDVDENTQYFVTYDLENLFINSILYYTDILEKFDKNNEGVLIGIPVRHVCSVTSIRSMKTLNEDLIKYFNFLYQVYINEENPTTLNILLLKNGELYSIYPLFDEEGNFLRFLLPSILSEK